MIVVRKQRAIIPNGWLRASIGVVSGILLCGVLPAQDLQTKAPTGLPAGITSRGLPTNSPLVDFSDLKAAHANTHEMAAAAGLPAAITPGVPHRITLEEAQQQAAAANPMAHLAQLQVEAARQHRLGAESDYFPKLSSTLTNFHFNKFMGQEVTIQRPVAGGTVTAGLPLAGKDQRFLFCPGTSPLSGLWVLTISSTLASGNTPSRSAMPRSAWRKLRWN